MVLVKTDAEEVTYHQNSIGDDIKWMTEGEFTKHTLSNEEVNIGKRTGRALAFLDTWSVINVAASPKCTLRGPKRTSIYTLIATTHWSIREG